MSSEVLLFATDFHNGTNRLKRRLVDVHGEQSATLTEKLVSLANQKLKPDLMIGGGDTASKGEHTDKMFEVKDILGKLKVPQYHALGNHCHRVLNGYHSVRNDFLDREQIYTSFDTDNFHYIILNVEKNDGKYYFVDDEQLEWFKADLRQARKPTIVTTHQPVRRWTNGRNEWFDKSPRGAFVKNGNEVRATIEASRKVILVLSGHIHATKLEKDGDIVYLTQNSLVQNDVVTGKPSGAYGVIKLGAGKIKIEVYRNVNYDQNSREINGEFPMTISL